MLNIVAVADVDIDESVWKWNLVSLVDAANVRFFEHQFHLIPITSKHSNNFTSICRQMAEFEQFSGSVVSAPVQATYKKKWENVAYGITHTIHLY